jgi:hypothetical protein
MATYTSTKAGPWNDPATWGGGGYPVAAGDIANIGHTVTYNVVSTAELGQININSAGILTFSTALSTKLTLGHQDIVVNNGGELRVGASGAIIPKTYTAELIWNTTADNAKGINLAAGGKLTVYGDPDYFGSVDKSTLIASSGAVPAAGNAITITVAGDFTTKWIVGQELLMHKGGSYGTTGYINDFCRLTIASTPTANGANTDVPCTVTERPATLTCLVGADVLHLTRNVMFYKYGYNANLGQWNSNHPRITNANAAGTANINMSDVSIAGFYQICDGYNVFFNGVVRNSRGATLAALYLSTINGLICMNLGGMQAANNCIINAWIASAQYAAHNATESSIINGNVFGCGVNANAINLSYNNIINGHIYSCYNCIDLSSGNILKGNIGYDGAGIQKSNITDFIMVKGGYKITVVNSKSPSVPVFLYRNTLTYNNRVRFEHFLQVADAHYVADAYGDIYKVAADGSGDNPSQRSGGGAEVLEVVPQSNCAATSYLELLNVRLWAAAGVSKTYRFYVQTDFATLPTAELKLYGEYLDAGSGGHLATATPSTQDITTRANAADWSQYVEVTINPAQDGYVNLYIRLMGYESSKKVWIDPKVAITGGDTVTVTPRWSYGDVQLDIDPVATGGGGSLPTNPGLLPLGVMEVVV